MAANVVLSSDLSSSEASAAEIISKMSEYQFIAVVQDGNACEPMEQVVNEKGEVVAVNTNEYYETIGEAVELNFDGISDIKNEGTIEEGQQNVEDTNESHAVQHFEAHATSEGEIVTSATIESYAPHCSNLKDMLLPLGIKISNADVPIVTKKKRPKSSLFIGCTADATQVIQDFENLKDELEIKSNVEMLRLLLRNTRKEMINTTSTVECIVDDGDRNTKAILQLLSSSEHHNVESKIEASGNNEEVTINIVNGSTVEQQMAQQQDITNVLGLTALNIKTIQLSKKYLEHIEKEGFYISGFVDGSEKLDEFLKFFRIITGSAFSIRRSKAKINDDPEPEEKPLRKYKPGYLGKGQIKWEKNIGIPPIPFTGVPFTTEGSTTYQCIYGPKRVKTGAHADQKENTDDEENTSFGPKSPKRRRSSRESKKKDCPAQIHIRTVHRFPTYNCLSPIQPVKTTTATTYVNKCQRGIILAKLREDIVNEKVHGEQGFWIRVPLPEVHQNHSLGPFDGCESPLTEETILEMKSILHNAAITS